MSKGIIVNGMSCSGCENIVEDALEGISGVADAEADHESDRVRIDVSGDPSTDRIIEAVDFAGYEAEIPGGDEDAEDEAEAEESDTDEE